ncbi:PREDICTED: alpha-(1,3)-fucosyltransferase 7-like [Branchiostoma belcheri]|uniref:Fucosyltransferase n=1 Tax=Branchiostoma belcheri TaxID=7741 RepID=A0A6P4YZ72_BRABE|nr:PREDICTED: alpha-(1,3)-fucosyltransferase 7-like [Branchiostoma belcheri]
MITTKFQKEYALLEKTQRFFMLSFFVYIVIVAGSYIQIPGSLNVGYKRNGAFYYGVENVSFTRIQRSALPRYDHFVSSGSVDQLAMFYSTWKVEPSTLPVKKSPDRKKIIIWNPTSIWPTPKAIPCLSMPQCEFIKKTKRRRRGKFQTEDADAIIFRGIFGIPKVYSRNWFPKTRPEHQIWIYFPFDCPPITRGIDLISYGGVFNWTMSYRNDSDILAPWGHITPVYKALAENPPAPNKDYAKQKNKLVIWYVSDCYKYMTRFVYAAELSKHIQVDVFGVCGNVSGSCPKNRTDRSCIKEHVRPYKFYLAFENFKCVEYITEKFWHNSVDYDIVPIVLGPSKGDYERVAPPNSFVHVDDFESPEAMANYLTYLDHNDEEYNRYFAWKTNPPKNLPDFESRFCEVCKKLLQASPTERKVYTDVERWWKGGNYEFCEPIVWDGPLRGKKNAAHFP